MAREDTFHLYWNGRQVARSVGVKWKNVESKKLRLASQSIISIETSSLGSNEKKNKKEEEEEEKTAVDSHADQVDIVLNGVSLGPTSDSFDDVTIDQVAV